MNVTIIFLKYLGIFYILFGLSSLLNKKISETMMILVKDDGKLKEKIAMISVVVPNHKGNPLLIMHSSKLKLTSINLFISIL